MCLGSAEEVGRAVKGWSLPRNGGSHGQALFLCKCIKTYPLLRASASRGEAWKRSDIIPPAGESSAANCTSNQKIPGRWEDCLNKS
jgi:hypothetical protein